MADSMKYRLDANDREIVLERLRDELGITKDRWKADVLDAALLHLVQSFDNLDAARGEIDPATIQQFNTDVLALHYRTSVDATASIDLERPGRRGNR